MTADRATFERSDPTRRAIETVWRMESARLIGGLARLVLTLVDELAREPALRDYHLLPSVRGELLCRLGRLAEARQELERAASLAPSDRDRGLLRARAGSLGAPGPAED